VARTITFAGSITWLNTPFDNHDLATLRAGAAQIRGFTPAETGLLVVSLSGVDNIPDRDLVTLVWSPNDILTAWTG
jgi:uncharacterized protein